VRVFEKSPARRRRYENPTEFVELRACAKAHFQSWRLRDEMNSLR
jgi:hypothetical protein